MSDDELSAETRPRYTSTPLPPYSYVPGHAPHPVSDERGHMFGAPHQTVEPLRPDDWPDSPAYLFAADLFNHGYYWEAHEQWESLWHAAGRSGPVATWLKALIKFAAAGVKAREGNPVGVGRHAERADVLLTDMRAGLPVETSHYGGVSLAILERNLKAVVRRADEFNAPRPTLLLPYWLDLGDR